ncbi:hypothetical protein C0991_007165, partial [Blastosporella zonata]
MTTNYKTSELSIKTDTPLKATATIETRNGRTTQPKIHKMLKEEIGSHLYVAENDKIIDHTFPVSRDLIDGVYKTMVSSQYYDTDKHKWRYRNLNTRKWDDLPQQSKKESTFYAPLVYLCEAIREAYRSQNRKAGVDTEHFESRW